MKNRSIIFKIIFYYNEIKYKILLSIFFSLTSLLFSDAQKIQTHKKINTRNQRRVLSILRKFYNTRLLFQHLSSKSKPDLLGEGCKANMNILFYFLYCLKVIIRYLSPRLKCDMIMEFSIVL